MASVRAPKRISQNRKSSILGPNPAPVGIRGFSGEEKESWRKHIFDVFHVFKGFYVGGTMPMRTGMSNYVHITEFQPKWMYGTPTYDLTSDKRTHTLVNG